MHMFSWRDEYEAWAVTRGEDGEVDLKNTQEKYVLSFLLKDANDELCKFREGVFSILELLHN